MSVKFNLLPHEYSLQRPKEKINFSRVIALLLLLLFVGVSSMSLFLGFLRINSLKNEYKDLVVKRNVIMTQNQKMTSEHERLKNTEKIMNASLIVLQKELPLLEFFRQIELSMPDSVWLTSIKAGEEKVAMGGYSYNEGDVVLFATGLIQSPTISQVGFPNTKRVSKNGESLVAFKLTCQLEPMGQVKKVSSK